MTSPIPTQPGRTSLHIALTGHRPTRLDGYDLSRNYYRVMHDELVRTLYAKLSEHDHVTAHSGMALGADTVWAYAICTAKMHFPSKLSFVADIPCPQQASRWPQRAQEAWHTLCERADKTVFYAEHYTPNCLDLRNEGMIDSADTLIAIWDGKRSGGTYRAIQYAQSQNVKIISFDPDQFRK